MNISKIMAYQKGELDSAQIVALFQQLFDSGALWHLQKDYQDVGRYLLQEGLITRSPNHGARKRSAKRGKKAGLLVVSLTN